MAKPICVIYYFPTALASGSGREPDIYKVNEMFREMFPDYHVLAIPSNQSADGSCEDIRLQVFHEKDFTEIQYEELKKLITESINQTTNG
jgi:hypothetical protein